ncbi:hypothetical protein [Hyphococcus sp.]|uniref:hypothetical protein n=1 Tax=Hyphococcus sp. TaxID=2038636 RepID=UPI003CCB856E
MSAVTTLAVTVVAAVGAVTLYRFAERRSRPLREKISGLHKTPKRGQGGAVIDYERDPESGVYRPRDQARR